MKRSLRSSRALSFAILLVGACGRSSVPGHAPHPLAVHVLADSARRERLSIRPPPEARVWLSRVAPAASGPGASGSNAHPGPQGLPAPQAASDTIAPNFDPPPLDIAEDLKPPILRSAPALVIPSHAPRAEVELDVRVDESGEVSDALWAEGSTDPELVAAATACALGMRFYPALQEGRPIAVWCRQRFDFGAR
jgi:outer membrane biosynthesis protein TonB